MHVIALALAAALASADEPVLVQMTLVKTADLTRLVWPKGTPPRARAAACTIDAILDQGTVVDLQAESCPSATVAILDPLLRTRPWTSRQLAPEDVSGHARLQVEADRRGDLSFALAGFSQPVRRGDPTYPPKARNAGYPSQVGVTVVGIGTDGTTSSIAAHGCAPPFVEATERALASWTWTPPRVRGASVPVRAVILVKYRVT